MVILKAQEVRVEEEFELSATHELHITLPLFQMPASFGDKDFSVCGQT